MQSPSGESHFYAFFILSPSVDSYFYTFFLLSTSVDSYKNSFFILSADSESLQNSFFILSADSKIHKNLLCLLPLANKSPKRRCVLRAFVVGGGGCLFEILAFFFVFEEFDGVVVDLVEQRRREGEYAQYRLDAVVVDGAAELVGVECCVGHYKIDIVDAAERACYFVEAGIAEC
jgi:hypothetical protein